MTEGLKFTVETSSIITPEDFRDYWDEMHSAFAIHIEKENIRHGLWKEYPAKDQINQIRIKADRLLRSLETGLSDAQKANAIEELYDIMNYSNFSTRILKGLV